MNAIRSESGKSSGVDHAASCRSAGMFIDVKLARPSDDLLFEGEGTAGKRDCIVEFQVICLSTDLKAAG